MSSPKQPHIVVTGASGFVGTYVMRALADAGEHPVGLCRKPAPGLVHGYDLEDTGDLSNVLKGCKAIVHCAARVHSKDAKKTALADHMKANRDGTAELIKQAEAAGVKTIIFLSTVAVYGFDTHPDVIDITQPEDPKTTYAKSKLAAEHVIENSKLQSVILRVPQVYGPFAPGLWRRMLRLCDSAYPLPFGFVGNRRSMIAVQNLASLMVHCLDEPNLPPKILATDHADIGTTEIARTLREAYGRTHRLFPAPLPVLRFLAYLTRRTYLYDMCFSSLRFAPTECGWRPPLRPSEALKLCAKSR